MRPNLPSPLNQPTASGILKVANSDTRDIMSGDFVSLLQGGENFVVNGNDGGHIVIGVALEYIKAATEEDPNPHYGLIATSGIYNFKVGNGQGGVQSGTFMEANIDGSQTIFLAGSQGADIQPWAMGLALDDGAEGDIIPVMLLIGVPSVNPPITP